MSTTALSPLTGTWTIDPVHSSASFAVKHLVATFRAGFDVIEGSYDADAGVLRGTAPVASLDVTQEDLKGHLLSPDFFDATAHPTIDFVSTAVQVGQDGTLEVQGDLTLRGVTRPVTGRGSITEVIPGPGGDVVGIEVQTTVNRNDFGLSWNADLPGGRKMLGDDVTLSLSLELGQPTA
ncbi:YceI family protein [Paraconexibacter sp.]|uniref:YceI family protein n=1 Tax=Paraconexibacter sp. TaxID=2949640 RepID=UPI003567E75E